MEAAGFLCLLLCGSGRLVSSETLHVSQKEGNIAVLHCGKLTSGKVTWSRDTNGQRVDILTTHNGETTKHINDPDSRYSSGANLALTIFRVSQSDAGRYYCSGATVELTVTDKTLHVRQTEGNIAILHCGRLTSGKVTWSRDTNGQRVDILTTHNGETTKHIADPGRRYNSQVDLVLIIRRVSQSDAGRYYCSGATVELSVTSGTILWSFLIIAGFCLVAVVLVLFSWRRFHKRKAYTVNQKQEHLYDSIDVIMLTTQPASDQQNAKESIYHLATHPGVQITDDQQSAHEATEPLRNDPTPTEQVEQLYAKVKKPKE
ncbi:hypothetical protein MHYP_G00170200 [Metynnis hypsauchen]